MIENPYWPSYFKESDFAPRGSKDRLEEALNLLEISPAVRTGSMRLKLIAMATTHNDTTTYSKTSTRPREVINNLSEVAKWAKDGKKLFEALDDFTVRALKNGAKLGEDRASKVILRAIPWSERFKDRPHGGALSWPDWLEALSGAALLGAEWTSDLYPLQGGPRNPMVVDAPWQFVKECAELMEAEGGKVSGYMDGKFRNFVRALDDFARGNKAKGKPALDKRIKAVAGLYSRRREFMDKMDEIGVPLYCDDHYDVTEDQLQKYKLLENEYHAINEKLFWGPGGNALAK